MQAGRQAGRGPLCWYGRRGFCHAGLCCSSLLFRRLSPLIRCWQNSEAKHLDITGHTASVNAVKLSSCLKYIISCSFDKTAKLWSLANGKCLYTFVGHTKKVNDCDIHVNFQYDSMNVGVVTCGSDAMICYWNCTMPSPLKTVTGHSEAVYRCSFSPDGQRVVSCSEDMTSRCLPHE